MNMIIYYHYNRIRFSARDSRSRNVSESESGTVKQKVLFYERKTWGNEARMRSWGLGQVKINEEVLVVTAYRWSEYLGALDVSFDKEGRVVNYTGALIHMTNTTTVDEKLQIQIREWAIPFIEYSNQVVGKTDVLLDQSTCLRGECNISDVISDAMQWYR